METNTLRVTSWLPSQASSLWSTYLMMDQPMELSITLCIISKTEVVQSWECTTLTIQSLPLQGPASSLRWTEDYPWSWALRTRFWRSMMAGLRTSSRRSMWETLRNSSRRRILTMNTDSLMIWLLRYSKEMEVSYGLARTTMEMYKVIL